MHALIIEDDPVTAMLIEDELHDLGFESTEVAGTEDEAVAAVVRRIPDLVTSDGSLLMGSGAGAVRRIRAAFPVPVVFITGDPGAARQAVPNALVLGKPFSAEQFSRAVGQATAGAKAC